MSDSELDAEAEKLLAGQSNIVAANLNEEKLGMAMREQEAIDEDSDQLARRINEILVDTTVSWTVAKFQKS